MNARTRRPIGLASLLWIAALAAGCGGGSEEDTVDARLAKLEALAPVSGVVTVGGKPLPGVVVTFIPEEWAPAHGETDDEGRYTLETAARPGAIPGKYKVALSYLVAADGRVLGLDPRGGFVPDPAVATAVEKLPPEYVSPEKTPLTAEVSPGGGAIDFDIDAQIEPAAPQPEAAPEPAADPAAE